MEVEMFSRLLHITKMKAYTGNPFVFTLVLKIISIY